MHLLKHHFLLPAHTSNRPEVDLSFLGGCSGVYVLQGADTHRIYAGHSRQESLSYAGLWGRLATHEHRRGVFKDESVQVTCWTFDSNLELGHSAGVLEALLLSTLRASSIAPLLLNKQYPRPDPRSSAMLEVHRFERDLQDLINATPWDAPYQHVLRLVQAHFESTYSLPWDPVAPLCQAWLAARPDQLWAVKKDPDSLVQALGLA